MKKRVIHRGWSRQVQRQLPETMKYLQSAPISHLQPSAFRDPCRGREAGLLTTKLSKDELSGWESGWGWMRPRCRGPSLEWSGQHVPRIPKGPEHSGGKSHFLPCIYFLKFSCPSNTKEKKKKTWPEIIQQADWNPGGVNLKEALSVLTLSCCLCLS